MRQFDNPFNVSKKNAVFRVRNLDPNAEVETYTVTRLDQSIAHYINIDSILADTQLESLFNQAETAAETSYFANDAIDRAQLKAEYQNMINRLEQIQNAGTIPFTQAGFNLLVAAEKDKALYIERIMKFLKQAIT